MKTHSTVALTLLAALLAAPTLWADPDEGFDICQANSEQFVRYVNGALSGANITAHVAGTSVPFIVAENTALVIASPAVAAASGYAVIGAGGVFVFLNAYCNTPAAIDVGSELYESAVSKTVDVIEVGDGTYKVAIERTTDQMEGASTYVARIRRSLTNLFCAWGRNC